jgi:hypothetical protein
MSKGDPDVYLHPAVKPNGAQYYEMLLVYVDDILHITHHKTLDQNETMQEIGRIYQLKEGSMGEPSMYLGANVGCVLDGDGNKMWYLSATDYIDGALKTVTADVPSDTKLKGKADRPLNISYHAKLDATLHLDPELIRRYQGYIGILWWIVELGRVNIMVEVSYLSLFLVAPRVGHLEAALSIFAYLQKNKDLAMFFNPCEFDIDKSDFPPPGQWKELYGDITKDIPPNLPLPIPLGAPMYFTAYVNADHASNKVTRRSQTGFIVYGNCALLIWFSKKQNTIETATFGSKLVALQICMESLIALQYKVRTFGVPIPEPAYVFCNNESVVNTTSHVEGCLNKKHLSICFHRIRETFAQSIRTLAKVAGEENIADLFTKMLPLQDRTKHGQKILQHWKIR